jgi:hypothetical protein
MDRSSILTGGLLLAAAVVLPGLLNYVLKNLVVGTFGTLQVAGQSVTITTGTVGSAIWVLGYLGGILIVYTQFLRPMDIRGPDDSDMPDESADN